MKNLKNFTRKTKNNFNNYICTMLYINIIQYLMLSKGNQNKMKETP